MVEWLKSDGVRTALLTYVVGVTVWGVTLHNRVDYLEKQMNKGERFTAAQGETVTNSLQKLTVNVAELMVWRAKVSEHMDNHDETSTRWIQQIEKNAELARDNNLMLHQLLIRHKGEELHGK